MFPGKSVVECCICEPVAYDEKEPLPWVDAKTCDVKLICRRRR